MITGIFQLIDGALVHELRFETIANNLGNLGTNGFRRDLISFDEALSMNNGTSIDLSPGPVRHTGNDLDIALETPGFFKVQTTRGVRYTRDGSLSLRQDGTLVTHSGDPILGESGPITINGGQVSIERDGRIMVDNINAGKLSVVNFTRTEALKKEGASCLQFDGNPEEVIAAQDVNIQQGFLEGANINLTEEMIKMLEAYRAYESAQKAVQVIDEMNNKIVNDSDLIQ